MPSAPAGPRSTIWMRASARQYDLGREAQAAGAADEPAVVETHHARAGPTATPVQRIGEVEPAPVQVQRILHGLPAFDRDVRHAQEMLDHSAEGGRLRPVEAAHHPFEFEHHSQRNEHRRGFEHDATRQRPLARRVMLESPAVFVPLTVVLEFEWVMRGFYRTKPASFCRVVEHLLGMPHVTVERWEAVKDA